MVTRADLGEFELIARYLAPLTEGAPLAFGLTDDAAIVRPGPGEDVVITKDALVAGVHFLAADPPTLVAKKLLRVNLSDLAAMGAVPTGYLIAAVLPRPLDETWIAGFTQGLAEDQREFGVSLLGGDTVATDGPLTLTLTALGTVPSGRALRRNGARPGDHLYVSGAVGDGALGLRVALGTLVLDPADADWLLQRYRCPSPRVTLGPRLVGLATAAIDVSDGLAADLGHVCETSGCAATVATETIPLSDAVRSVVAKAPERLADVLTGGDDYELLFTAPPGAAAEIDRLSRDIGLPITKIGEISAGSGASFVDKTGQQQVLPRTGYRHF